MFKILDGRSYLYQWDLDRKLIVDDNTINKVYFCNKLGNCSIVRCVYDVNGMRLVDVPNLILQKAFNMYVYGYDSNYTKYEEAIEIKARTKPEDYIYTDEEIKVWDELAQRLEALEEAEIDIDLSDYYTKTEINELLEEEELVEVDNTLTIQGMAADSKAVGDRLNSLDNGKVNISGWNADINLGTDKDGNVIEKPDMFKRDTTMWKPVNAIDGIEWTEQGYYWRPETGELANTEYTKIYKSSAKKIPVKPNCKYVVSLFMGQITLYDESGINGEVILSNSNPNQQFEFITNQNQVLMTISVLTHDTSFPPENIKMVRTTMSEDEYNALPLKSDVLKTLYGKVGVAFGDSLFGMYRGETSTPAYIAKHTGATVYNVGYGGCRMAAHTHEDYNAFSMYALTDAITNGDWAKQDAAIAGEVPTYFDEQLAVMKTIDYSNIDFAVIHYGTNDFTGNVVIDNTENIQDTTTLCGALRYSIERLLTAYPQMRLYVSLPAFRYWEDNGIKTYSDTYTNGNGKTLLDYVNAIKNVAENYNIIVIDCYHGLGINQYNCLTYLDDGTHHNENGRKRFGTFIGAQIIANI